MVEIHQCLCGKKIMKTYRKDGKLYRDIFSGMTEHVAQEHSTSITNYFVKLS